MMGLNSVHEDVTDISNALVAGQSINEAISYMVLGKVRLVFQTFGFYSR